jgi:Glucodextranase, domain B
MSAKLSQVRGAVAVAASACVALALAAQLPALAAPGSGTWTEITSPDDGAAFLSHVGHEGHLTIKGTASTDVSQVNVYCLNGVGPTASAITVATAVIVTSGSFSSTVPVPGAVPAPQCHLRALPDGVNPQAAYVASYAGPVVNFDSWSSDATELQLTAGAGSTVMTASSLGSCTTADLIPVSADQTAPGGSVGCMLSLGQNASGTRAAVVVDGHPAFPPADATRFGVTPRSSVHATFHKTKQNTVRWTDAESLDRCATDGAFPPGASCVLKDSGVQVRHVLTMMRSGQVRVRAEFASTDGHRHVVKVAYTNVVTSPDPGELGVRFPGQKKFHAATEGQRVRHLGHGAGTMFARTNRFGDEGDPTVATRALSWSRPPSGIVFSPTNEATFELDYRLVVPKHGSAFLGFGDSVAVRTTGAVSLGAKAERDMMPVPVIVGPRDGAVLPGHKTTVTGVVHAGANGLPVTVTVNGHRVKLKVRKGGRSASFTDTFTEGTGKHIITVRATDSAGNSRSSSIRVRNK